MRAVAIRGLVILLVAVAGTAFAARPAKIDNTTLESFRASWQALISQLNPNDQLQLQFAVVRIALAAYRSAADVPDDLQSIGPETVRDKIDGMTYADIMKLAGKSSVTLEQLKPCDSHSRAAGPCTR
jgi:hypothetical protein